MLTPFIPALLAAFLLLSVPVGLAQQPYATPEITDFVEIDMPDTLGYGIPRLNCLGIIEAMACCGRLIAQDARPAKL